MWRIAVARLVEQLGSDHAAAETALWAAAALGGTVDDAEWDAVCAALEIDRPPALAQTFHSERTAGRSLGHDQPAVRPDSGPAAGARALCAAGTASALEAGDARGALPLQLAAAREMLSEGRYVGVGSLLAERDAILDQQQVAPNDMARLESACRMHLPSTTAWR
jgi:hypothetical protein